MTLGAAVSLHLIQPVERNIQGIATRKLQDQVVTLEVLDRKAFQAPILRDAVLHMHDVIADAQVFQRGQERGGPTLGLRLMARAFCEEFLFGQEGEPELSG